MIPRRREREAALQVLYGMDANTGIDASTALDQFFERFDPTAGPDGAQLAAPPNRDFVLSLVRDVWAHRQELDEIIAQVSRTWRVERMSIVDRNIIRMAICELKYRPGVPGRVALYEAIELARRFGTEESPAFVNGVLDSAWKAIGSVSDL